MSAAAEVIVDGRALYAGHRLAWRRGIARPVVGASVGGLHEVTLERRGRERKNPCVQLIAGWLLIRTDDLCARMQAHGLLDGRDDARLPDKR